MYRASKERDLLPNIATNLGVQTGTEVKFIQSFRDLIAAEVTAGRLPSSTNQHGIKEDTYDILAGMGDSLGAAEQLAAGQRCLLLYQNISEDISSGAYDLDVHYKLQVLKENLS